MLLKFFTHLALALIFILPAGTALADMDDELVIVITDTQSASENTQGWLDYMKELGIPSIRLIGPADFDAEKQNTCMMLMATPGDPELNGDILPLLLDADEIAWLSEPGNRKFYYLDDIFTEGQTIILFAGSSQRGAEAVRQNSRGDWEIELCNLFNIPLSPITLFGY